MLNIINNNYNSLFSIVRMYLSNFAEFIYFKYFFQQQLR